MAGRAAAPVAQPGGRGLDGGADADHRWRRSSRPGSARTRSTRSTGTGSACRRTSPTRTGSAPTTTAATCSCAALYGARVSLAVGIAATLVSLVDRRHLRRRRGLFRRQGRRGHDAHRRHHVLAALHVLRHHPDGRSSAATSSCCSSASGAVEWLTMARIVRGQTLSMKHKEFIEAAHAGRRLRLDASSSATSCPTCWGRW